MWIYCLKRLLLFFPTLLGIIILTFVLIQLVPGGPIEQVMAHRMGMTSGEVSSSQGSARERKPIDKEQMEELKKLYGFDKPVHERLAKWVVQLFTFQFGNSFFHHKSVIELVKEKLPVSMSLGILSFLLTYLLCIPLGIHKALKDGSFFDLSTSFIVLVGYAVPGFVLGVFLIVLFAGGSFWNLFPLRGLVSDNFESLSQGGKILDYLHHLFLPMICMTIGSFAVMTNLTKNTILEQIKQNYVLTARSKGLPERHVIYKHVFRNAMIPLVTGFAGSFLTMFFGASLLIETMFSLDGLGLLSYESVIKRDYPVVMANVYFFSLLFLVGNLLSDLMYILVDPRIDFKTIEK